MKEAIQSRLDKYNKDNNVTEDIKITNFKSSKSININNNINTQKNTDKKMKILIINFPRIKKFY